jgi:hypothetical protein
MNLDGVRITLRLHRFELISFGAALGGLALASALATLYVASLRPGPGCLALTDTMPAGCQQAFEAYSNASQWLGGVLLTPLLLVTYAVGLFLGVPLVARELERGTVRLAWSLAPSRWGWYLGRMIPVLIVLVVLTFAAGAAIDQFFAASRPGFDIANSFDSYGLRGGLLASRAVVIFGVAVMVGSIIGRVLPSVIIAALVATIGLTGIGQVHQELLKREAIVVDQGEEGVGIDDGDLWIDSKFRLPDGTLVGWEYFGDQGPVFDEQGNPQYPQVNLVIPGERYRFVEAREALALAGASLLALLLAAAVVLRRRPG